MTLGSDRRRHRGEQRSARTLHGPAARRGQGQTAQVHALFDSIMSPCLTRSNSQDRRASHRRGNVLSGIL
eukprot:3334581-Rhodomonas_salina.1